MTVRMKEIGSGYWKAGICYSCPHLDGNVLFSAARGIDFALDVAGEHDRSKHSGQADIVVYTFEKGTQVDDARRAHVLPE